jgi:hypothetical protein
MLKKLAVLLVVLSLSPISAAYSETLTAVFETPNLDGVDNGDWAGDPITTSTGVSLKAAYDSDNIYILATWTDDSGTESIWKKLWTYDGMDWSQSGNEDRVALMWDIGTTPEGASCATMCHPPQGMYTSEGTVDIWHWKSMRSNPMGYVDDKYFIAIQDTTPGGETRLGDGGNNTYDDNFDSDPFPLEMATSDPNASIDFLVRDTATLAAWDPFGVMGEYTVEVSINHSDAGWSSGSTVAGYIYEMPDGSRADVMVAGDYDNGAWTIEMKRSLTTSGPDDEARDVQFDPAQTYGFTVAEFDNTGDENHQVDVTVHTLAFEQVGIGDEEGTNRAPLSYKLSQNYPNPFNPSTTISYVVPGSRGSTVPVLLEIFSLRGQLVRTLVSGQKSGGEYSVHWDGKDRNGLPVESGIYLYRLQAGEISSLRKMALLK